VYYIKKINRELMMIEQYFDLTVKTKDLGNLSFYFYLLDKPYKNVIAEDDFGNKIINDDSGILLYVHDADESIDHVKLFDNLELFYKKTNFHENDKRFEDDDEPLIYNEYNPKDIEPCSIYISEFIKTLGIKRLLPKYKEGSYYNISQAYIDGSITKDEFILLSNLDLYI
jgi:hypothetical protein